MTAAAEVPPLRLAVLISGRGSNMLAIAHACQQGRLAARIVLVAADQADAPGLALAAAEGLVTAAVPAAAWRTAAGFDRAAFESALAARIEAQDAQLVVLAGFMRVLSAQFVTRFAGRILNIHPSLLPLHKGLHTHERALAAGAAQHGVSVHFVTAELDGGPVIAQSRVPILASDTVATLSARVQQREHILYPRVIDWIATGRLACVDGRILFDDQPLRCPLEDSAR